MRIKVQLLFVITILLTVFVSAQIIASDIAKVKDYTVQEQIKYENQLFFINSSELDVYYKDLPFTYGWKLDGSETSAT